jgi:hypothetical protein
MVSTTKRLVIGSLILLAVVVGLSSSCRHSPTDRRDAPEKTFLHLSKEVCVLSAAAALSPRFTRGVAIEADLAWCGQS